MPTHAKSKPLKHWSKSVRDVSVAHDGLHVRIDGGAENGELLFVGGFTTDKIKYRKGRFHVGDILIELNDEPVVGLTLQDLMNRINEAGKTIDFKAVQPGGGISKDIRDFLDKEIQNSSEIDLKLQDVLRDNLYSRTVPCTTRPPRAREEPGIDYIFVSKEKFKEMEENGDFLESGTNNGHYYGTLKPALQVDSQLEEASTINEQGTSSMTRHAGENYGAELNATGENNEGDVTIH